MSAAQVDQYRDAVIAVIGDFSDQARQTAQHIEWAYDTLLSTVAEVGGHLTEEGVRDIVPAQTFRLGIEVGWLPYLDENGDPRTDSLGELDVAGYGVRREYYDAFLSLLPIESYAEFIRLPWATTPEEIIADVQVELGWGDPEFIEAMQEVNNSRSTMKNGEQEDIDWRDSKERYGLKGVRTPPGPNSRPRKAQTDHRETAWKVIVKHSKKYATLPFEKFNWMKAGSSTT
ncbi:MAG TPA: hypothetical protein VGK29_22740 [Paludibaculum sp.]|jgi:hypothetical protein